MSATDKETRKELTEMDRENITFFTNCVLRHVKKIPEHQIMQFRKEIDRLLLKYAYHHHYSENSDLPVVGNKRDRNIYNKSLDTSSEEEEFVVKQEKKKKKSQDCRIQKIKTESVVISSDDDEVEYVEELRGSAAKTSKKSRIKLVKIENVKTERISCIAKQEKDDSTRPNQTLGGSKSMQPSSIKPQDKDSNQQDCHMREKNLGNRNHEDFSSSQMQNQFYKMAFEASMAPLNMFGQSLPSHSTYHPGNFNIGGSLNPVAMQAMYQQFLQRNTIAAEALTGNHGHQEAAFPQQKSQPRNITNNSHTNLSQHDDRVPPSHETPYQMNKFLQQQPVQQNPPPGSQTKVPQQKSQTQNVAVGYQATASTSLQQASLPSQPSGYQNLGNMNGHLQQPLPPPSQPSGYQNSGNLNGHQQQPPPPPSQPSSYQNSGNLNGHQQQPPPPPSQPSGYQNPGNMNVHLQPIPPPPNQPSSYQNSVNINDPLQQQNPLQANQVGGFEYGAYQSNVSSRATQPGPIEGYNLTDLQ